ncbi:hypothetical protein [Chryseobacterium shandongense]|uniref:Uncharacterized protein n=1 Tax=Chryseobacterium shandongense TaxID=1493872 RepID=A0ABN5RX97_9FLAO|nr:hypothetical protein [Chryseobacterium shandongense]AZA95339.1 hypothetical protein EG353_07090 [Chryseobacterium shandongense]
MTPLYILQEDYNEINDYINKTIFKNSDYNIEEVLFLSGLDFCKDQPAFYADLHCFWSAYKSYYYESVDYFLFSDTTRTPGERYKLIKQFTADLSKNFKISDELREDIFIEYNQQLDAKMALNKKNGTKSTKSKKSNLNSI